MRNLLILIPLVLLSSCWLTPERVNNDDVRLRPFLEAMSKVNRDSLGFTKIDSLDKIQIEEQSLIKMPYDAMLHLYGNTSRTISFKKIGNTYQWIGEQEIHTGPRDYETPDGIFKESITITFERIPISGHNLNTINIGYLGPDSYLYGQDKLTLTEAQQIIYDWGKNKRATTLAK